MKTYSVLFAEDVPHYGTAEITCPSRKLISAHFASASLALLVAISRDANGELVTPPRRASVVGATSGRDRVARRDVPRQAGRTCSPSALSLCRGVSAVSSALPRVRRLWVPKIRSS
jgi:hypothetical protein